jgi:hypothetical protein
VLQLGGVVADGKGATSPPGATMVLVDPPKDLSKRVDPGECGVLTIDGPAQLPDLVVGKPWYEVLAAHGGTPPYSWTFSGLLGVPLGIDLCPFGRLQSKTGPVAPGTYTFQVSVTDAVGNTASQLLTAVVQPANTPVSCTPAYKPPGDVGGIYCGSGGAILGSPGGGPVEAPYGAFMGVQGGYFSCTAIPNLAYSLVGAPAGISIDPQTGLLSGMLGAGPTGIQVQVTDNNSGVSVTGTYTITVPNPVSTSTGDDAGSPPPTTSYDGSYSVTCQVTGQLGNATEGPTALTFANGVLTNGAASGLTGSVSAGGTMTLDVTDSCGVTFPVSGAASATAGAQFQIMGSNGNDPSCAVIDDDCTVTRQ